MAEITAEVKKAWGHTPHLIPQATLAQISQVELLDRLVASNELVRKSQQSTDPTLRRGYASLARATLTAQPRATTERQAAELVAKASGLGNTSQADAVRRQAQELYERHPIAPRREEAVAVMKATADANDGDLLICYDETGRAFGVISRSDLQPVGRPADVAKMRMRSPGKGRSAQATKRPGQR